VSKRLFVLSNLGTVTGDFCLMLVQMRFDPTQNGQCEHVICLPLQMLLLVAEVLYVVMGVVVVLVVKAHGGTPWVLKTWQNAS